jgi:hypothetical protein
MNALKHMELIFGAVMVVGCVIAALPDAVVNAPASHGAAPAAGAMQVVVVKAKRMTAFEKNRSLELDSGARTTTAGS